MKRTVGCRANLKRHKPENQANSLGLFSSNINDVIPAASKKSNIQAEWAVEQDECLLKVAQANRGNWRAISKIVTKRFHELPRSGLECKSRYERLLRDKCNDACSPQFEFLLIFFCHCTELNWLSISKALPGSITELQHLFCQYLSRIAFFVKHKELPCFEKINPTEIMKILIGIEFIIKSLNCPEDSFPELLEALNEKNITIENCFTEIGRISKNSFLDKIKWNSQRLGNYLMEATEGFLNSVLPILSSDSMEEVLHKRLPPYVLRPDMALPPPLTIQYSIEGLQTLNSWLMLLRVSFSSI